MLHGKNRYLPSKIRMGRPGKLHYFKPSDQNPRVIFRRYPQLFPFPQIHKTLSNSFFFKLSPLLQQPFYILSRLPLPAKAPNLHIIPLILYLLALGFRVYIQVYSRGEWMAGGGSSNAKGNISGVRVIVAGDPKTGKSSLILTAATESFPASVPPVLPPTRLPDDLFPDRVPVTIIDTSSRSSVSFSNLDFYCFYWLRCMCMCICVCCYKHLFCSDWSS